MLVKLLPFLSFLRFSPRSGAKIFLKFEVNKCNPNKNLCPNPTAAVSSR
jgi:hypothetical protein